MKSTEADDFPIELTITFNAAAEAFNDLSLSIQQATNSYSTLMPTDTYCLVNGEWIRIVKHFNPFVSLTVT